MKTRLSSFLAIALLALSALARAEDIDLFVNGLPASTADIPNVIFVIDNTGNWNTNSKSGPASSRKKLWEIETQILKNTILSLPVGPNDQPLFRVGIILGADTTPGFGNSNVQGGYVRAALRPMTAANKAAYAEMVLKLLGGSGSDTGSTSLGALQMAEAYRYLTGGAPYAGNNKSKADFAGNTGSQGWGNKEDPAAVSAAVAVFNLPVTEVQRNALASKGATQYEQPPGVGGCAKNFIIYLSNGPQGNEDRIKEARALLASAGGDTTPIPGPFALAKDNIIDEWARFMRKSPLGVVSYTVDIDRTTSESGEDWTFLLKSTASVSNGKYFDVSSENDGIQISGVLSQIFSEIQAVNTVFASVSLPVSVNSNGSYLNQVFIGMFRPDANGYPRWQGNLKQYRLALDFKNDLVMVDAAGSNAVNSQSGFIEFCARSYWTPTVADSYWAFDPKGSCRLDNSDDPSNSPDGNMVEKGGQAYMARRLRTAATQRKAYTCATSACNSLGLFSTTTATAAALGGGLTTTEHDQMIRWAKGEDVLNENRNLLAGTAEEDFGDVRPSVHGDVIHSRPLALNFAAAGETAGESGDEGSKVVVIYGSNDGFLRAINGNRTAPLGSVEAGEELWSFMPPEFFPRVPELYRNSQQIRFYGSNPSGRIAKPYAIDGPLTSYQNGSSTWVFAPMRRGGQAIYAFDVSGLASGSSPSLKWKGGCGLGVCRAGYESIGQTWSAAKPILTLGYTTGVGSSTPKPMLIMGGGYDAQCEDADTYACGSPNHGNRVYVIDASNGDVLKQFPTLRPVVGDIFVVPEKGTERVKWAYVADLGGNLYRISGADANSPFGTTAPGSWTITRIASLGGTGTSARKFFFAPDVVEESPDPTPEYRLLIGSGDREKPLRAYTNTFGVNNYFFMVRDRPTDPTWLSSGTDGCGGVICFTSLEEIATSASPSASTLATKKGWALKMRAGEQVVTAPLVVFDYATFSTQIPAAPPAANVCSSGLGEAYVYNVSYKNADSLNGANKPRFDDIAGDGLPPSPVAGQVILPGATQPTPFIIGASGSSPLESRKAAPPAALKQPKGRVFWQLR